MLKWISFGIMVAIELLMVYAGIDEAAIAVFKIDYVILIMIYSLREIRDEIRKGNQMREKDGEQK